MPVHPLCVPSGLMREEENTKQRTGDHEINFLLFVTGNRRQETAGKVIDNHSPLWKLNVRLWRGEVQGGRLGRRWENRKGSRITPPKQDNSPRAGNLPCFPRSLRGSGLHRPSSPHPQWTTPSGYQDTELGREKHKQNSPPAHLGGEGGGRHVRPQERRMQVPSTPALTPLRLT